jgi:hypothetical protein
LFVWRYSGRELNKAECPSLNTHCSCLYYEAGVCMSVSMTMNAA